MLPVSHVMQLHCVSCGSFESSMLFSGKCSEYGERVRCEFRKLSMKQKIVHRPLMNKSHVLNALATSNISVVHTAEKVATYRFWTETGDHLKVLVEKKNEKYGLYVEFVSLQLSGIEDQLIMSWGLFRSDSTNFMPLNIKQKSSTSKQLTIETPFVKDLAGRLVVELDLDASLAPFYVSILLKSQRNSKSKTSYIRTHRETNFVVPVGFGSGVPLPLGISFSDDGSINFAFFSRNAKSVVLCLYDDTTVEKPAIEIDLDPYVNRSGDVWHASLDGSMPFVSYGYRCRSDTGNKDNHVLLDPYAKVIEDVKLGSNRQCLGKICRESAFDWSGEVRPGISMEKLIVYKLNVQLFTEDKSSKISGNNAGSFCGITEKLDHFKNLGVNAILLEPIFPFDDQEGPYFPWHFFSPRSSYGLYNDQKTAARSIKEMVKKLHASGIEILLEVAFTHTSDVAALRDIDNSSYYLVQGEEESKYALNCNYPVVSQMILEILRHWVTEFHIDGFCFTNAFSLARGFHGEFLSRPPLIEAIAFDPLLSKVKIIADSWDPNTSDTKEIVFPHWKRWAEMNSKFCDDVRNFLSGKAPISNLATRLCGSGDLFLAGRGPAFSFNLITRNVGFTLVDLVSFSSNSKLAASQLSWNCGEEGPTNKPRVLETRLKQIRNFLFILFISLGVPVLNMGDECGQSSGGSLAYNDRKHLNWKALSSDFGVQITQFISFLSLLKKRRSDLLQRSTFLRVENIEWHAPDQTPPSWDDPSCTFLAVTLKADSQPNKLATDVQCGDLFVAFNRAAHSEIVALPLSALDSDWVCLVDTALPFPGFFNLDGIPFKAGTLTYEMKSHSCVLFEAKSMPVNK